MKLNFLAFILSFLFAWSPELTHASEPEWTLLSDDYDVKVYKGVIKDSPLLAFKGIKKMPASISKIAEILLSPNLELRKKWVTGLMATENLEIVSDREAYVYTAFKMPWPISNRDFVTHCRVSITADKQQLVLDVRSVEHPKAPATIGVRGEIRSSTYILKSLAANETEVTVMAQTDHKGSLPTWLVNGIQRYWPAVTLKKLEELALDSTSAAYADIK